MAEMNGKKILNIDFIGGPGNHPTVDSGTDISYNRRIVGYSDTLYIPKVGDLYVNITESTLYFCYLVEHDSANAEYTTYWKPVGSGGGSDDTGSKLSVSVADDKLVLTSEGTEGSMSATVVDNVLVLSSTVDNYKTKVEDNKLIIY